VNRYLPDTAKTYDAQANVFDIRAELGQHNIKRIATAITKLTQQFRQAHLLDIGCGTGELGSVLAGHFDNYVGIDISQAMLEQFRNKHDMAPGELILSDANTAWPVASNSIDVIFSSRALHWIDLSHTVSELYRVARNNQSLLIVGRMEMDSDSWELKLREQCHRLLGQQDLVPRKGEQHLIELQNSLKQHCAEIMNPLVACEWHKRRTPDQAIKDWQDKPGLAGISLPAAKKIDILKQLRGWVNDNFANVVPGECSREFVLYPIRLNSK
jgi:ubiquinone/menaquinone biosynthesis C-methylase UbiE